VGTATVIPRYAGFIILTDPNFLHAGDHVHLGYSMISKRLTNPALKIDALPPLDLCLLSHLHADHFDRVAEARLNKDLPMITTRYAAANLRRKGFLTSHGLRTWDSARAEVEKGEAHLTVMAMPARHGPGMMAYVLTPGIGTMRQLQRRDGRVAPSLYITGDTLLIDELKEIPRRATPTSSSRCSPRAGRASWESW
jgi:L-ascorbate metabolism protein UlaG (beta-lactamase superfamily)